MIALAAATLLSRGQWSSPLSVCARRRTNGTAVATSRHFAFRLYVSPPRLRGASTVPSASFWAQETRTTQRIAVGRCGGDSAVRE